MNRIVSAVKNLFCGSVDHIVSDLQRGVDRLEALARRKADEAAAALERASQHQAEAAGHQAEANRAQRMAANIKGLVS